MKLKNLKNLVWLILTLGVVAYLDSPYSILNKNYSYTAEQPVVVKPAAAKPADDTTEVVEKLKEREKVDGYIVETYAEYEIVRDKNGKVVSSEPTGQEDTLKYWDYSEGR